jgi:hypothetical protein
MLSYVLVIILFLHALFSPAHTVILRINGFGEAFLEAIFVILSLFAVPVCIKELVQLRVIIPFWRRKNNEED